MDAEVLGKYQTGIVDGVEMPLRFLTISGAFFIHFFKFVHSFPNKNQRSYVVKQYQKPCPTCLFRLFQILK